MHRRHIDTKNRRLYNMITFKTGNIFEEDIEAIVNTVNCIGIMGRDDRRSCCSNRINTSIY